ncbi:MAG: uracil phosphoribosyltransferase [Verrucomicrobia bacterium]|nr:uracil phosphoribosyltransferase [Verrucomicrobiota bacterium]
MKDTLLTTLRDKKTDLSAFRQAANNLCSILASEVASSLEEDPISVETPFAKTSGKRLSHSIYLLPIMRAGTIFLPPFLHLFPSAKVGFFGIRRDEKTADPKPYYENLPKIDSRDEILLLDPMIATGGTALWALDRLAALSVPETRIRLVGVIASVEGIQRIKVKYPHLKIIVAAEDPQLDAKKFINPGLGDFGDRYFGN